MKKLKLFILGSSLLTSIYAHSTTSKPNPRTAMELAQQSKNILPSNHLSDIKRQLLQESSKLQILGRSLSTEEQNKIKTIEEVLNDLEKIISKLEKSKL